MSRLDAARWITLRSHADARGELTAIEGVQDVPFEIRRVYFLGRNRAARGGHAHRDTHQVIIAAAGSFTLELADPSLSRRYVLDAPGRGVYVAPLTFIRLEAFSVDAVVLVLASTHYEPARSIRTWDEYVQAAAEA